MAHPLRREQRTQNTLLYPQTGSMGIKMTFPQGFLTLQLRTLKLGLENGTLYGGFFPWAQTERTFFSSRWLPPTGTKLGRLCQRKLLKAKRAAAQGSCPPHSSYQHNGDFQSHEAQRSDGINSDDIQPPRKREEALEMVRSSAYCSHREPEFGPQHPEWWLSTICTCSPRRLQPSSGLKWPLHTSEFVKSPE